MAMADLTSFDAQLKEFYHKGKIHDLSHKKHPALDWCPKSEGWTGDNWVIPMMFGRGDGISATFTDAQLYKEPTDHERFTVDCREMYGLADIKNKLIRISVSQEGSFMPALTTEISAKFKALGHEMAQGIFAKGDGVRGLVVSKSAFDVVVSKVAMRHLNRGARIQFGTDATDASANVIYKVLKRNVYTNTVTLDQDTTADGDVIATSVIVRKGDANLRPYGFNDYLLDPTDAGYAAELAATFLGMDRSADATRLGGLFYDASGDTIEDGLIKAGEILSTEGAYPDACFIHPQRWVELDRLIESGSGYRSRFTKNASTTANIGFTGMSIAIGGSMLEIMQDSSCDPNSFYMLQQDTWSFRSAGPAPGFLSEGSLEDGILRNSNSDSVEARLGLYGNLGCSAPGLNLRGKFA